jgi:hypothetical protein
MAGYGKLIASLLRSDQGQGGNSILASSGNVANAVATATLAAAAGKTNYLSGFEITGAGATAASVVVATVTGLLGGTLSYVISVVAGATLGNAPLVVEFDSPIAATAVNTAIAVSCPALGAGNTNCVANAHGYQV